MTALSIRTLPRAALRRLLPLLLAGAIGSVAPGLGAEPEAAMPRFDGSYRQLKSLAQLRFFDDGTLAYIERPVGAGNPVTFSREEALALGVRGRYKVRRGVIELSYKDHRGNIRASGRIEQERVVLSVQMPGWKYPHDEEYVFVQPAPPVGERPLGERRIRIDGVYEFPDPYDPDEAHYLRFTSDGKVIVLDGSRHGNAEMFTLRPLEHFTGSPIVPYRERDGAIEFEVDNGLGVRKYRVQAGTERLAAELLGVGRTTWENRRYYEFVALKPPPTLHELTGVRVGQARLDDACEAPNFTPAAEPFPAGTREIAYEVQLDPRLDSASEVVMDARCGTAATRNRACNGFSIVNGRPVVTRSTVIVTCDDGGPFRAGRYVLRLSVGQPKVEVQRLEFTVR